MNSNRPKTLARNYIDQILERDVDLLLLEELHCELQFQNFLAAIVFGPAHGLCFLEAWNSVTDASLGESDLIVIYAQEDGRRVGVLLENKIKANFMREQA